MMGWLLDTNVISELKKASPDIKVLEWVASQPSDMLYTSSVNIAEIRFGIVSQADTLRQLKLTEWLEDKVRPLFEERILQATEPALLQWRIFASLAEKAKQPAPSADLLIAAIACLAKLPVATRDVKPFIGAGVPVLNPWTGERFNGA